MPEPKAPPELPEVEHDHPQVRFDAAKGCNYHLDAIGARVEHGVPEGFRFTDEGVLEPIEITPHRKAKEPEPKGKEA